MMFPTLPPSVAVFVFVVNGVICGYDDVPAEVEPWNSVRSYKPLDFMVDITNKLGLNVLFEHNFLNDNNIAFSPYGLTGILVALYEGVDGYSSLQIRDSMQLPADRRIVRIGFRDIHRRLRSYFIPEEGFLAGLTFNNENVTFRKNYRDILQFYGYDFEMPKPLPTQSDAATTVPHMSEAFSAYTSTTKTATEDVEIITTTAKGHIETNSVIPATAESVTPFGSTNSVTESTSTVALASPTTESPPSVASANPSTESTSTLANVNPKTDPATTFQFANPTTQPAASTTAFANVTTESTSESVLTNPAKGSDSTSAYENSTTKSASGSALASSTIRSTSASSSTESTSTLTYTNTTTKLTSTLPSTNPTTASTSTLVNTSPTAESTSTLASTSPTTESTSTLPSTSTTTETTSTLASTSPTTEFTSTRTNTSPTTESTSTMASTSPATKFTSTLASTSTTTETTSTLANISPTTEFTSTRANTSPTTESTFTLASTSPATESSSTLASTSTTTETTSTLANISPTTEFTSTRANTSSTTESTSTLASTSPTTESTSTLASSNRTTESTSILASTNPTAESSSILASTNPTAESSSTLAFTNPTTDSSSTPTFVDRTIESTSSVTKSTTEPASTESFSNSTTKSSSNIAVTNATTQTTTTNAVEATTQLETNTLLITNPSSLAVTTLSGESENEIFILESTTDDTPTTESKFTQNPEVQSTTNEPIKITNSEPITNTRVSRSTEDVTSKSMMLIVEETLISQFETSTIPNTPTAENNFEEISEAITVMDDIGTTVSGQLLNSSDAITSGPSNEGSETAKESESTTNIRVSEQMTTATELMNNTEEIFFSTTLQTTVKATTENLSTILITAADLATSSDVSTTESQMGEIQSTFEDSDNNVTEMTSTEKQKSSIRKKRSLHKFQVFQPILHDQFAFYRPLFLRNPNYARSGLQYQRSFLANGYSKVQITYMTYDTILEFAYIPYLKSMAVKLPLDTSDYYLMIILPDYEFGVNQLINDLRSEEAPSLRDINYLLSNTHVRAWVPSFMLKGLIVLTTDLQKLGICDVFEPRQDDFKPMTEQKNIYVRNIEQAITVTIRKYMEPNLVKRYVYNRPPVEFAATHPFVYFVMDSSLHVALMAGKIVNPLNSRIL